MEIRPMSFDFNRFIRQPTTIHALGCIAAGVGAALAHVATGNPHIDLVVAGLAYIGTHLGIDDNSATEAWATAFTNDLLHGAAPVKMLTDASGVAGAFAAVPSPAPQPVVPEHPAPAPAVA